MIKTDHYQKGSFDNPSDDNDPAEKVKDKDFFLKKGEWLWSLYVRDQCFVPYSKLNQFTTLRLYAQGRQPTQKYMEQLTMKQRVKGRQEPYGLVENDKFIRKGMMNISWDIYSPMPKFRNKVIGMLDKVDFKVNAHAVDEESDRQRNMMKWKVWAMKENAEFLQAVQDASGIAPLSHGAQIPFEPESKSQLDILDQMGSFKLWTEIVMEKLIRWSFDMSDWTEIKKRMYEDAFDIGYMGCKDYTDPHTERARVEYVDMQYFVGRENRFNDFHDLSEAGQIRFYYIQTLRETGEFTDDELRDVAISYQGSLGNPYLNLPNNNYQPYNSPFDYKRFKFFKVAVLDFEFESTDTEVYQVRKVGDKEVPFKSSIAKKRRNEKYADKKRRRFYRCKWVIGTRKVYDYGYQYNVPYHNDDEPRCSFSVYRIQDRSLTDLCIPSLDQLQIAVLRYRNAVAKAPPSGVRVEFGSLSNMSIGGNVMSPMDILKIYRDTGDLIYKASVDQGGRVIQGVGDPISELKGGMGPILQELMTCFSLEINNIREITGLNAVVDASAPTPESQVGTSKIAESATNDVMRPILNAYKFNKQRAGRNMASRWQIIAAFAKDPIKAMITSIGSNYTEIVRIGSELSLPTFGITFESTVDDAMIARIDNAALASMQMGKNGQPGITMSDYFMIQRFLEHGECKMAEVYLSYREQAEYARQQQVAMQNQQENAKAANALEEAKGKNKQSEIQLELEKELQIIRAKGDEDRKTLLFQMQTAMKLGVKQEASSAAIA